MAMVDVLQEFFFGSNHVVEDTAINIPKRKVSGRKQDVRDRLMDDKAHYKVDYQLPDDLVRAGQRSCVSDVVYYAVDERIGDEGTMNRTTVP